MLRIIDMTLSCLEEYNPSAEQLKKLYPLLLSVGADILELSTDVYQKLENFIPDGRFMLRVKNPEEAENFPEFKRFVCRKSGYVTPPAIVSEYQANDIKEINFIHETDVQKTIRIVGFDDIMNYEYLKSFANLKKQVKGHIELCPENDYFCATAIAVEWVISGGTDIVTTFGGLGGKASLEEVMMGLRIIKRYKPNMDFTAFSQIRILIEEIILSQISDKKAVIGKSIFDVESGIHIDGIIKNPKNYEPFSPELVGSERKFVLGKHSGKKSVILKLRELGLFVEKERVAEILDLVKTESTKKKASLTDQDFYDILRSRRYTGSDLS